MPKRHRALTAFGLAVRRAREEKGYTQENRAVRRSAGVKRPRQAATTARLAEDPAEYRAAPHRFIDLFCGIGGFRIAFEKAGGQCVFSSDYDKFSQQTYEANFGEKPHGDIHAVAVADIPAHDISALVFRVSRSASRASQRS